jgi:molybdopterin-synthase adenylyltransferase
MSRAERSVAMTGELSSVAQQHLLRKDGQEDLCFALWHPSRGKERNTALVRRLIFPETGDRNVHGNVSFEAAYFERALAEAAAAGAGLALMHSHPRGLGWQGMSKPDIATEQGISAAVFGATCRPFVGLTVARDGAWSARFWERAAPRTYSRGDCATVRVLGDRISVTYMDQLAPPPLANEEQIRTVSSWGERTQRDLARLRIGVVGNGSVGGLVAEALARTGFEEVVLIDFDRVEKHNLDRLNYATREDIGKLKVEVLGEHLIGRATAAPFHVDLVHAAVYEEEGFRSALDCDVLFSCVDRPWGRYVLNLIAFAHLIPVIDGGISVRTNRHGMLAAADWRAHTATFGRRCLQCLSQYDPGLVQTEREGLLDNPSYIEGLPRDHPLKSRENVFAFSMACASLEILQMLALAIAPLNQPNPGAQLYHFVGNITEEAEYDPCHSECQFPGLAGLGDDCGIPATGTRSN